MLCLLLGLCLAGGGVGGGTAGGAGGGCCGRWTGSGLSPFGEQGHKLLDGSLQIS